MGLTLARGLHAPLIGLYWFPRSTLYSHLIAPGASRWTRWPDLHVEGETRTARSSAAVRSHVCQKPSSKRAVTRPSPRSACTKCHRCLSVDPLIIEITKMSPSLSTTPGQALLPRQSWPAQNRLHAFWCDFSPPWYWYVLSYVFLSLLFFFPEEERGEGQRTQSWVGREVGRSWARGENMIKIYRIYENN